VSESSVIIRFPVVASAEQPVQRAEAGANVAGAPGEISDELLLSSISEGDKEALSLLFRRYARLARGLAYRVLRDASEADDLVQDIFILIHRLCGTFDSSRGSARFWILQMTYRRAISRRRYLVSRHFYNAVELEEVTESIQDHRDNAATALEEQLITRDVLQEILPELSEDQQKTLQLYFYDGYTFEEIAAKLGQTAGNVSHHYYRGLEKLRRLIFDGKLWNNRAL
jgi:RNA polymerase sigma-70 factor (ECF subfamily)